MARVKGGLGESSLIKDLTKPISFHISESLEPPPVFERRKKGKKQGPAFEGKPFPQIILEKAAAMTEGCSIQVVFHLEGNKESLLLDNNTHATDSNWRVASVKGKEGEYLETSWKNSIFSGFDAKDVIDRQAGNICSVEVVTDESLINFSSLDDFYEWLEIQ